jgi:3-phosphoinositide dependent protein kinase-1
MMNTQQQQEQLGTPSKRSIADFELIRRIGDGSYSHVVLARHKTTGEEVALKVVDKKYVVRHNVINYIRSERALLASINYEGFINLKYTFQDVYSLYMALEYCPNGELYDQIRLKGRLTEADTRFYAAEIVLMLEQLRRANIVHRDLKPENLLLDIEGHLKLIDFGSAKKLQQQQQQPGGEEEELDGDGNGGAQTAASSAPPSPPLSPETVSPSASPTPQQQQQYHHQQNHHPLSSKHRSKLTSSSSSSSSSCKREVSLVGTADYVSPEILNNERVTCAADLWALGCVVYQMMIGRAPFKAMSEYLTFQLIVAGEWSFPSCDSGKGEGNGGVGNDNDGTGATTAIPNHNNRDQGYVVVSEEAKDLITQLLQLNPRERLGANDIQDLKNHPFFRDIDWNGIRNLPAPEVMMDELDSLGSGGTGGSSFDWELQSLSAALPSISQMKGNGNELVVGSFDDEAPRRGRGMGMGGGMYGEESDDEDDVLGVI